jgi:hypothetical protein
MVVAERAVEFQKFQNICATYEQPYVGSCYPAEPNEIIPLLGETADLSQIYEAASHCHSSQIGIVRPIIELRYSQHRSWLACFDLLYAARNPHPLL